MTKLEEGANTVCEQRRVAKDMTYEIYLKSSEFQELYKEMSTGGE